MLLFWDRAGLFVQFRTNRIHLSRPILLLGQDHGRGRGDVVTLRSIVRIHVIHRLQAFTLRGELINITEHLGLSLLDEYLETVQARTIVILLLFISLRRRKIHYRL